ncbi:MAG: hypothetical protein K2J51_06420 [Alistipes sp.]|nr:hypothetical protein [Alistipes sp.]
MVKIKYHLHRVAIARYVDSLFYERGNPSRNHIRVHSRFVCRLCGIGQSTFRKYLRYPSDALAGYELPAEVKNMLLLYVTLHKMLPAVQVSRFLHMLTRHCVRAADCAGPNADSPAAEKLFAHLFTNGK